MADADIESLGLGADLRAGSPPRSRGGLSRLRQFSEGFTQWVRALGTQAPGKKGIKTGMPSLATRLPDQVGVPPGHESASVSSQRGETNGLDKDLPPLPTKDKDLPPLPHTGMAKVVNMEEATSERAKLVKVSRLTGKAQQIGAPRGNEIAPAPRRRDDTNGLNKDHAPLPHTSIAQAVSMTPVTSGNLKLVEIPSATDKVPEFPAEWFKQFQANEQTNQQKLRKATEIGEYRVIRAKSEDIRKALDPSNNPIFGSAPRSGRPRTALSLASTDSTPVDGTPNAVPESRAAAREPNFDSAPEMRRSGSVLSTASTLVGGQSDAGLQTRAAAREPNFGSAPGMRRSGSVLSTASTLVDRSSSENRTNLKGEIIMKDAIDLKSDTGAKNEANLETNSTSNSRVQEKTNSRPSVEELYNRPTSRGLVR